jgi:hypothetical protein
MTAATWLMPIAEAAARIESRLHSPRDSAVFGDETILSEQRKEKNGNRETRERPRPQCGPL